MISQVHKFQIFLNWAPNKKCTTFIETNSYINRVVCIKLCWQNYFSFKKWLIMMIVVWHIFVVGNYGITTVIVVWEIILVGNSIVTELTLWHIILFENSKVMGLLLWL